MVPSVYRCVLKLAVAGHGVDLFDDYRVGVPVGVKASGVVGKILPYDAPSQQITCRTGGHRAEARKPTDDEEAIVFCWSDDRPILFCPVVVAAVLDDRCWQILDVGLETRKKLPGSSSIKASKPGAPA